MSRIYRILLLVLMTLFLTGCTDEAIEAETSSQVDISRPGGEQTTEIETMSPDEELLEQQMQSLSDMLSIQKTNRRVSMLQEGASPEELDEPGEYAFRLYKRVGVYHGYYVWVEAYGEPETMHPEDRCGMYILWEDDCDRWRYAGEGFSANYYAEGKIKLIAEGTYSVFETDTYIGFEFEEKDRQRNVLWQYILSNICCRTVLEDVDRKEASYSVELYAEDFTKYDDGYYVRERINGGEKHYSNLIELRGSNIDTAYWSLDRYESTYDYCEGDGEFFVSGTVTRRLSDADFSECYYLDDTIGGVLLTLGQLMWAENGTIEGTFKGTFHLMSIDGRTGQYWLCREGEEPVAIQVNLTSGFGISYDITEIDLGEMPSAVEEDALLSVTVELTTRLK